LIDACMLVISNLIFYNPALFLRGLEESNTLQSMLTKIFTLLHEKKPKTGVPKYFKSTKSKKILALALISILGLPDDQLPEVVRGATPVLFQVRPFYLYTTSRSAAACAFSGAMMTTKYIYHTRVT